jgi:hypothetical protein
LHISGGLTKDYFNTSILVVIGLFNLVDQIIKNQNIIYRSYLTIPFIVLAILIFNKKTSSATKSIIFMLLGVIYHISIVDSSDLGSSVFFILAFVQHKNIRHGIVISITTLVLIVVMSTKIPQTPSQIITIISVFILIYGNIYQATKTRYKIIEVIPKPKPKIINLDIINITQEEKAILKLYCNGYDYEKISKTLGLNVIPRTIRRKIIAIKDEHKLKNDVHFAHWLFKEV